MADQQETVQAEVVEPVKGKVVSGFGGGFSYPTPMWATWIFRVEFFANKALLYFVANTHHMSLEQVQNWILWCVTIDGFVWGLGKSIGIKPPEEGGK